jgi:transcription antitermination factor NusG
MPTNQPVESWHVAYTMPRSEQKIYDFLRRTGVTSFFPVQSVLRKWSDRIKRIELPLFPNYIFVRVSPQRRFEVTNVEGVVRYVSFAGRPAVVPDSVIESLQKLSGNEMEVDQDPFYHMGMPVMICEGPFAGVKGYLVKRNGKERLQVRVETLKSTVSIEISTSAVVALTAEENEKISNLSIQNQLQ